MVTSTLVSCYYSQQKPSICHVFRSLQSHREFSSLNHPSNCGATNLQNACRSSFEIEQKCSVCSFTFRQWATWSLIFDHRPRHIQYTVQHYPCCFCQSYLISCHSSRLDGSTDCIHLPAVRRRLGPLHLAQNDGQST